MYIRIYATPDARKERFERETEDSWRISVRQPAEGNRANDRIRELIARELGIPVSSVRILTGHRSRSKIMSVDV